MSMMIYASAILHLTFTSWITSIVAQSKYSLKKKIDEQFVKPHNYRVNAAKPAVKAVKYHTIAALTTVNPTCLLQLWNKMVPQIQDTLNTLRTSQQNSKILAYEHMEGSFDWNQTPLAPLGCRPVVYSKPNERASRAPHTRNILYVGRSPLHYRFKTFYMCDTHGFTNAVGKLYRVHCSASFISKEALMVSAAANLVESMQGTVPAPAIKKQRHIKVLNKPLDILNNSKPRRVADDGKSRVSLAASSSTYAISLRMIASTRFVHQRETRNNTPMPSILEEEPKAEATPPDNGVQNGIPASDTNQLRMVSYSPFGMM